MEGAAGTWGFRRAVARVAVVDDVIADYAVAYYGRPVRRRDEPAAPGRVTWSVDEQLVVELRCRERGPDRLTVHELGLLEPLRKRLRSRHVTVEPAPPG